MFTVIWNVVWNFLKKLPSWVWVVVVIIVLVALLLLEMSKTRKYADENDRLSMNQTALLRNVKTYKKMLKDYSTTDSVTVSESNILQLKVYELKNDKEKLSKTIGDLNIKLKDVNTALTTALSSNYPIEGNVVTKVINKTDTVKCLTVSNKWYSFDGCYDKIGKFKGGLETRDSLQVFGSIVHKKFLFFNVGVKAIKATVVSYNPYSKINYSEFITITK
jgi:type II secretory pathway pseudopilin PulG